MLRLALLEGCHCANVRLSSLYSFLPTPCTGALKAGLDSSGWPDDSGADRRPDGSGSVATGDCGSQALVACAGAAGAS